MAKIEHLILKSAPSLYNALRPSKVAALPEKSEPVIKPGPLRKSRKKQA
jgi:hypothetical protein